MPTVAIGSITNSKLLSYSQELVIPPTPARLWFLSNDALARFFSPPSSAHYPTWRAGWEQTIIAQALALSWALCQMISVHPLT